MRVKESGWIPAADVMLLILLGVLVLSALADPGGGPVHIPRNLYVSVKDPIPQNGSSLLLPRIAKMYDRARQAGWTISFVSNDEKTAWMEQHWGKTPVLWAYRRISPQLGVAKADIWRLALLHSLGGVYIDSDAVLDTPLDDIIRLNANSSLIVTKERNYQDECYLPTSPLSTARLAALNTALYYTLQRTLDNAVVSTWAIFASPSHPILRRTLNNIVMLVKSEYQHHTQLTPSSRGESPGTLVNRARLVLCITGPLLFTRTILQHHLLLNSSMGRAAGPAVTQTNLLAVYSADFKHFQGKSHVVSLGGLFSPSIPPTCSYKLLSSYFQ